MRVFDLKAMHPFRSLPFVPKYTLKSFITSSRFGTFTRIGNGDGRFVSYNVGMAIPLEIAGQKYVSLATFRKTGVAVRTPVWFGEEGGKIYVVSRVDAGKCKRIRNNPRVQIAPCTLRGKITGPGFDGTARILSEDDGTKARATIRRKYWLARIPAPGRKNNVYLEIEVA